MLLDAFLTPSLAERSGARGRVLPCLPFLLCALAFPAQAATRDAHYLEGYWYGEMYQPSVHETTQEFDHKGADGTAEVEFRLYKNCTLVGRQKEAGRWSATKDGYHIDTLYVDGAKVDQRKPEYHDDYVIDTWTETSFSYHHVPSGARGHSERVTKDFVFPACGT